METLALVLIAILLPLEVVHFINWRRSVEPYRGWWRFKRR